MNRALIKGNGDLTQLGVPMSWPVILSGVVCVAMLALGFNLLLPLASGLETVCILIGVASAMIFFGLVDDA
jgi:hypothetical protein